MGQILAGMSDIIFRDAVCIFVTGCKGSSVELVGTVIYMNCNVVMHVYLLILHS